jgi:hypothetical protein
MSTSALCGRLSEGESQSANKNVFPEGLRGVKSPEKDPPVSRFQRGSNLST